MKSIAARNAALFLIGVISCLMFCLAIQVPVAQAAEYEGEYFPDDIVVRYDKAYQTHTVGDRFDLSWDLNDTYYDHNSGRYWVETTTDWGADQPRYMEFDYEDVDFISSNWDVVTVNEDGECRARAFGSAVITATARDAKTSAVWYINVTKHRTIKCAFVQGAKYDVPNWVEFKKLSKQLKKTNAKARWYSSNNKVVSLNSKTGSAVFKRSGKATLTCKANGYKYTLPVNVVYKTRDAFKNSAIKALKKRAWYPSSVQVLSATQKNDKLYLKVSALNAFQQRVTQSFKFWYSGTKLTYQ